MARQTKTTAKKTTRKDPAKASSTPRRATNAKKAVIKAASSAMPNEEQIRARAFEVYLRRNGGPGDPSSDWYQAERELLSELRT